MHYPALPGEFYARDTVTVARALLGQLLIRRDEDTGEPLAFRIVETEAYTQNDPACHAFGRTTGRAATLYKKPGLAYVYLIYGMHHCLNVVTEAEGTAGAVLFRALEPLLPAHQVRFKTHGPGRLAKALNITTKAFNEKPLTLDTESLYLALNPKPLAHSIIETTRIGISQGQEALWRFYIAHNKWVSQK